MIVELDLQKQMKITLGTAFRMPKCLGWVFHNEENDTYYWYNSNELALMGEDLDIELLEIESIIEINNTDNFILMFNYNADCGEWNKATLQESINHILKCWHFEGNIK